MYKLIIWIQLNSKKLTLNIPNKLKLFCSNIQLLIFKSFQFAIFSIIFSIHCFYRKTILFTEVYISGSYLEGALFRCARSEVNGSVCHVPWKMPSTILFFSSFFVEKPVSFKRRIYIVALWVTDVHDIKKRHPAVPEMTKTSETCVKGFPD